MPAPQQSTERTVDLPKRTRTAHFTPSTANEDDRTIEVVWTTEEGVRRYDWSRGKYYIEVLSLKKEHVRLDRFNSGRGSLLNSHRQGSLGDVIGTVVSAEIVDGPDGPEGRAVVRFSKRDEVASIWEDVKDGIIANVSVGYTPHRAEVTENEDGPDEWLITDWTAFELSFVPVGADPHAGTRSQEESTTPCSITVTRACNAQAVTQGRDEGERAMPQPVEKKKKQKAVETTTQDDKSGARSIQADNPATSRPEQETSQREHDSDGVAEMARQMARDAVKDEYRTVLKSEEERKSRINESCRALGVDDDFARSLIVSGMTVDEANAALIKEAGERSQTATIRPYGSAGLAGDDALDHAVKGMEEIILYRIDAGNHELTDSSRRFVGMSLGELSRRFLEFRGERPDGLNAYEIAKRAMLDTGGHQFQYPGKRAAQGTTAFAAVLSNVANKRLDRGYKQVVQTFLPMAQKVNLPDFKQASLVALHKDAGMAPINEHGEYKRTLVKETSISFSLGRMGEIISLTPEVIMNDDLNAFGDIPLQMGLDAAETQSDLAWAIFINNAQTSDGIPLFHADHKNYAEGAETALSTASIADGISSIALQQAPNGRTRSIEASYLYLPQALRLEAGQILKDDLKPAKTSDAVPDYVKALIPIVEPRLDAASKTAWYLAAKPGRVKVLQYGYLEGAEGIQVTTNSNFETDGIDIKAKMFYYVAAVGHAGLYKAKGA